VGETKVLTVSRTIERKVRTNRVRNWVKQLVAKVCVSASRPSCIRKNKEHLNAMSKNWAFIWHYFRESPHQCA